MARFDDYDPQSRGHWLRIPLYKAAGAILVVLAVCGLLIFLFVNSPPQITDL